MESRSRNRRRGRSRSKRKMESRSRNRRRGRSRSKRKMESRSRRSCSMRSRRSRSWSMRSRRSRSWSGLPQNKSKIPNKIQHMTQKSVAPLTWIRPPPPVSAPAPYYYITDSDAGPERVPLLFKSKKNCFGSHIFDPVHRLIHLSRDTLISILL